MKDGEELTRISISQHTAHLTEPFTMIDLATIDDLVLSAFLCEGMLPHHRHMDQDELFLVDSGTIILESEWGRVVLGSGELAVVSKGVGHRSSSTQRSLVLLLQPRLMANRRNGDLRLFALKDGGNLQKVSVPAMGAQIAVPFSPVVLADLDTYALHLVLCEGVGPWWQADRQDNLVLCHGGALLLEVEGGGFPLEAGDLVVVPKGIAYRLSSDQQALAIGLQRHKQPGLPLPD
ncbi:hypothetical protein ACFLYD_05725 [Chloroflexota bacterium]